MFVENSKSAAILNYFLTSHLPFSSQWSRSIPAFPLLNLNETISRFEMLTRREKRALTVAFKIALLVTAGAILLTPELDIEGGSERLFAKSQTAVTARAS